MLKRNSKYRVLKSSFCTTLATLMLMPELNCFADETQVEVNCFTDKTQVNETIPKNKNTQNKISIKELKEKLGKISLKEWLALALGAGVPLSVLVAILKTNGKNKTNSGKTVKFSTQTLGTEYKNLLKSVFNENLTSEEKEKLETELNKEKKSRKDYIKYS